MARCPISLLALFLLTCSPPFAATAGELQERLRHRLEILDEPGELVAGGDPLFALVPLQDFYRERGWKPAWVRPDGTPSPALEKLVEAISGAAEHGLTPSDYHLAALVEGLRLLEATEDPGPAVPRLADIELQASDAFLVLARHYADGKVDPGSNDPGWYIERERPVLLESLRQAINDDPAAVLNTLLPGHTEYRVLVRRLALQRELAANGEWTGIEAGAAIHPGDSDRRVPEIRRRLRHLGDLEPAMATMGDASAESYDDAMEAAVRGFQARHGLDRDGVIGRQTLRELNVSPAARVEQLRVNLERWRWLPQSLGEEYILVNIAGFNMELVSGGERIMRQRVIVGRPYRRTPVFSGLMTYLVLNPSWEVPYRLAVRDKLPEIIADPEYLSRLGFTVLQGWGAEERVIEPDGVDWQSLVGQPFPYRLRQAPGPQNALGKVKFMFPNAHDVYLHGTPETGLFAKEERAFSSGCIRLEHPLELADWLLAGSGRPAVMTQDEIRGILESGRETTVRLGRPLPVHLLYWTAWVDDDGIVQYRRDIYGRDAALIEALNPPPPGGD